MDKVYVGDNAENIEHGVEQTITGVRVKNGDNTYLAGNTSGYVLEVDTDWGTQQIANDIFANVNGFRFNPSTADNVILDMAAEVGDGITVGDAYMILGYTDIEFDNACLVNVKSDSNDETSEYPYIPSIQRKVNNASATANSALSTANTALEVAKDAQDDADDANALIRGFQYTGSSVKINGANIMAGTVTASNLQGGTISLINASQNVSGGLSLGGAQSAGYAVDFYSNAALRLRASSGDVYITNGISSIDLSSGSRQVSISGNLIPSSSSSSSLGTSRFLWSEVYASTGEINTSDRKRKKDIEYDISVYDGLYDDLKPVRYKLIDGTSDRYHTGLIAQDIEESLEQHGIPTKDFATFVKSENEDGTVYGLRYEELIALNIRQIQSLKQRVLELENEVKELRNNGG